MKTLGYFAQFDPQPEGGFTVIFKDLPEVVTQGDHREEAIRHATEALDLAIEQRLADEEPLPTVSKVKGGVWVEPSAHIQAIVLIRQARQASGKNLTYMARELKTSWAIARKLESLGGNPTIRQLELAAAALGKKLSVSFQ